MIDLPVIRGLSPTLNECPYIVLEELSAADPKEPKRKFAPVAAFSNGALAKRFMEVQSRHNGGRALQLGVRA